MKKQFTDDSWIQIYWRPMMAISYMVICLWDFLIAPIFFQVVAKNGVAWKPLTLEGGGLYHVAMGAVIGVTAWTRGVEKQKLIENFDKISNGRIDVGGKTEVTTVTDVTTAKPKKPWE